MDYTSGPYTVTFPAGQTRIPFNVPISDDMLLEGPEDFMLTINSSSLPGSVRLGTPSEATVTIVDDDCKWLIQTAELGGGLVVYHSSLTA